MRKNFLTECFLVPPLAPGASQTACLEEMLDGLLTNITKNQINARRRHKCHAVSRHCCIGWWIFNTNQENLRLDLTSITSLFPLYTVLLFTMLTMATPRLHLMPNDIQNPNPLMMAMIYRRGSPKHVQSTTGRRFSVFITGLPSSVSSIVSPVFCRFSNIL